MKYLKNTNNSLVIKQWTIWAAKTIGVGVIVANLFYNSPVGLIVLPFSGYYFYKQMVQARILQDKTKLTEDFLEMLKAISSALLAGYSLENAWREAEKELSASLDKSSLMLRELKTINQSVLMNVPLEEAMSKFAEQTDVEEILNFSEIFSFAKRSGGNFIGIIDSTCYRLIQKYEAKSEIEVAIAAKRLEQKVMNYIPIFILAYLKLTSMDYMSVLYGNFWGIVFMTVCLMLYILAIKLSEKVMLIEI